MTAAQITSPKDALTSEAELDADSLSAIRSILTEEEKPDPRQESIKSSPAGAEAVEKTARVRQKADAFPLLQPAEADAAGDMAAPKPKRGFSLRRKVVESKTAAPKRPPSKQKANPDRGVGGTIADRIRAYRPSPSHIVLACLVLFVLMRPWLVLGLLFLFGFIVVGIFLITGYDGFWRGVVKTGRWYANRRPTRSAAIHARLDRFAVRWDSILDRFPEGTVDGLYLPDFGDLAQADVRHGEALDRRLAGLNEKGA